jgi:hypothetical protein
MIVFELVCKNRHCFEAWFPNSSAFEAQKADGNITCPFCSDNQIAKAPMAPRIGKTKTKNHAPVASDREMVQGERYAIKELRRRVEESCEYMGKSFPEEARRIHYGEAEERGIYGEATSDEARSLKDEGIEIQSIPWFSRTDD